MGFDQDVRRRVFELKFKPYPGLIVWCRKPGYAALAKLSDAVLSLGNDLTGTRLAGPDKLAWWGVLFKAFAKSLVAWNLTDGGRAVPATKRAVLDQDAAFLLAVVRTWYMVVVPHQEQPDTEETLDSATPDDDETAEREARLAGLPVTVSEDVMPAEAA